MQNQTRNNQVRQMFETADAVTYCRNNGLESMDQHSGVFTSVGLRENSTDSDRSQQFEELKKRKTTVFRQYTNAGESIAELEQTPQKRKIDELMGRTASNVVQQHASQANTNDLTSRSPNKKSSPERGKAISSRDPNAMKNLSVEAMHNEHHLNTLYSQKDGNKILVSNAHSRDLNTESLVSHISMTNEALSIKKHYLQTSQGSSPSGMLQKSRLLQMSQHSPMRHY